jgi:hypothetical protein
LVRKSSDEVESMSTGDVFKFPKLNISYSHIIPDLGNVKIKFNNDNKKYEIALLVERVSFEILG